MEVKKMKKLLWMFLLLPALFIYVSCEDEKEDPPAEITFDAQDSQGNLVVCNYSEMPLALYRGVNLIKKISSSSEDYLVNVPIEESGVSVELRLYRFNDVKDDLNNPDNADVFKKWIIPISDGTEREKRVTWHVKKDASETVSGTLKFNYIGGTEFNVDVFLNNRSGAKLVSLKPGDQYDKIVGIDYGTYTLLYRFWTSDSGTDQGAKELGWIEKLIDDDGEDQDIYVLLNDANQDRMLQVPHWFNVDPNAEKGEIQIKNNNSYPVVIYLNNKQIEEEMIYDGVTQGMSTIIGYGEYTYTVKADSTVAKHFHATKVNQTGKIAEEDFIIKNDEKVVWEIE
ncbi:MAG: hypothetical protein B6I24_05830 [Bacteroidetes bacterium 4572_128]|nr:MAG: hypothetical protein B6I24_05830 [Bacteroidetes bacterium 4572_128]